MRRHALAALLLAAFTSFAGIGSHALWTPDEPRDAAVGLEMLRSGDLVVPRLGGEPFLEKPPLFWWCEAASYRLFGVSDAAARVPSALFGTLSALVAFALGARLGGPRAGLLAAAVLVTTAEFSEVTHRAVVDPPLVTFVALAHLGAVLYLAPRSPGERRAGAALVALGVPLAFLGKGVVGPALALAPPVLYLVATRQFRALLGTWPLAAAGVPAFALLIAPWAVALYRTGGPDSLHVTLVANTIGRFVGSSEGQSFGHHQPPWYYLVNGPAHLAPWVIAIPAMLRAGVLRAGGEDAEPRRILFGSFVFGLLLLSAASGKRGLYLVPLFPAFAATVGWWLATLEPAAPADPARRWDRPTMLVLLGLAVLAPVALLAGAVAVRVHPLFLGLDLRAMQPRLPDFLLAFLGVVALGWARGLGARLLDHVRGRTVPGPGLVLAPLAVLFVLAQTAVKAAVDPVKDLHPLTAAIRGAFEAGEEIIVFRPDESIRGIVAYDLGRTIWGIKEPGDLQAALDGRPGRRLIYEDVDVKFLTPELKAGVKPLGPRIGPASRQYVIAEWRP